MDELSQEIYAAVKGTIESTYKKFEISFNEEQNAKAIVNILVAEKAPFSFYFWNGLYCIVLHGEEVGGES